MPYSGAATLADWLRATSSADQSDKCKHARTGQSLVDTVWATQARLNALTQVDHPSVDTLPSETPSSALPTSAKGQRLGPQVSMRPLESLTRLESHDLTVWLSCQLAAALGHAHTRGIVHGDVKPANVLLRNDGHPALIDFNLAQDAISQDDQLRIGGTLPYMAPEQMKALIGRHSLLSYASDVYSVGIVLYEILKDVCPLPHQTQWLSAT